MKIRDHSQRFQASNFLALSEQYEGVRSTLPEEAVTACDHMLEQVKNGHPRSDLKLKTIGGIIRMNILFGRMENERKLPPYPRRTA